MSQRKVVVNYKAARHCKIWVGRTSTKPLAIYFLFCVEEDVGACESQFNTKKINECQCLCL
jgi:hypothetical protein